MAKKNVIIGLPGLTHDLRNSKWRPTVAICENEALPVSRYELIFQRSSQELCDSLVEDIHKVSPATKVRLTPVDFKDAWDFDEVYPVLHGIAKNMKFDLEREEYFVNLTTGTHTLQICLFMLTASRHFPGQLIQAIPAGAKSRAGYRVIPLDLSKYDLIAGRISKERQETTVRLKHGIATRNKKHNRMIETMTRVASNSHGPMLLMGPTGSGKSLLAYEVYAVKKDTHRLTGEFVEENCATLLGDVAKSALFGHVKGAFTNANTSRLGLLLKANHGVLFLDEIGELGMEEQALLLRALETKKFRPVGSDDDVDSDFQLICGTNRDLSQAVSDGKFRGDLLSRINQWTFELLGLRDRREDIEPNIQYEVDRYPERNGGKIVRFEGDALGRYLEFAHSEEARWTASFRDLGCSFRRMADLVAGSGTITVDIAAEEMDRLRIMWKGPSHREADDGLTALMAPRALEALDRFERVQLADVVRVCRVSKTLAEAGRTLFSATRAGQKAPNDSDRLRKYLARHGLEWAAIKAPLA